MSCCCVPKIDRFLCRFSLQKGILLTVLTTSTIWILLLILYIPYQLLWSPFITAAEHDKTVYRIMDQAGVTLIIVLLFADSLLLVGVRKEEKVAPDMMVPWLFLHSLFIPSLPLMSLLSIFYFNNIILAALVSVPSIPYAYVWVALFNYRSKTIKTRTEEISLETGIQLKEDITETKILQRQRYSIVSQNDLEYSASSNHPDLYSR